MNLSQLRGEDVKNSLTPLIKISYVSTDRNITDLDNSNTLETNLLMGVCYKGKEKGKPNTGNKGTAVENIVFSFNEPKNIMTSAPSFIGFLEEDEKNKISILNVDTQCLLLELCKKKYNVSKYLNLIMKAIQDTSERDFCVCVQKFLLEVKDGSNLMNLKYGKLLTKSLKELKKAKSHRKLRYRLM